MVSKRMHMSLNKNWFLVINALTKITKNKIKNDSTRCELKGTYIQKHKTLEKLFMSILWGDRYFRTVLCML